MNREALTTDNIIMVSSLATETLIVETDYNFCRLCNKTISTDFGLIVNPV